LCPYVVRRCRRTGEVASGSATRRCMSRRDMDALFCAETVSSEQTGHTYDGVYAGDVVWRSRMVAVSVSGCGQYIP